MVKYRTRPGVVLTDICGENVLVSASSLAGLCPYVTQINDSSVFLWKLLEKGADAQQLAAAVEEEFEVDDPAALRSVIDDFIKQMTDLNYLLPDEQKGQE